jgi:hypothetical protein
MAKSGKGPHGGAIAEDMNRVSVSGRGGNALCFEVVEAPAIAGVIHLYNTNATVYTGSPTNMTTGAAILQKISHALWVGVQRTDTTTNDLTTTVALTCGYKIINGPTTIATVCVDHHQDNEIFGILVVGKSFN